MARTGSGLSDNVRTIISIIVFGIVAISVYLAALPEGSEMRPPAWVTGLFVIAALLANVIKDQLGLRDATTSAVAKTVDNAYPTQRNPHE